jgi:hypothetical protein
MMKPVRVFALALLLALLARAASQSSSATVRFVLDFPGSNPSHYEITVQESGQGWYSSNGLLHRDSEPVEAAPLEFTISEKARQQIFDLVRRAHYFGGKIDSGNKSLANTGAKTLSYRDSSRSAEATYNYPSPAPVQQLTQIFQMLSATLEYGRRLQYFHKYQKLAIEDDLKRMEDLQRQSSLGDVSAIAPVLKEIANDQSVMNVSRARALRLLAAGANH